MAIAINRKKYQEIRKMDHNQMNKYINSIYQSGYEAGKSESGPSVDTTEPITAEKVKELLTTVKGIGEKKAEDIINILAEPLNIQ